MPRFFMAGTNILGGMAIMKGRDAEHVRVLRLRPGEDMIICDGQGTDYKCRLVSADKEQVEAGHRGRPLPGGAERQGDGALRSAEGR